MKKKLMIVGLLALVLAALLWWVLGSQQKNKAVSFGTELLENGDFEKVSGEGFPDGWLPESYLGYADITQFEIVEGMNGSGIRIINQSPNDSRYVQTVRVAPNTLYRFSGFIKAEAEGGRGANLSVADIYVFSEAVYQTDGDWQKIELYGKTGPNQKEVKLFARLGGYSGEAAGEASFDSLSLVAVQQSPEGVTISSWEKPQAVTSVGTSDVSEPSPFAPWLLVLYALSAFIMVYTAKSAQRAALRPVELTNKQQALGYLALLILFALVSRLWLANAVSGFPVDVSAFRAWANNMADSGPGRFYLLEGHRDYPPGYMLVLWPLGLLGKVMGTGATQVLVKLPSILCDLGIIILLYQVAGKYVSRLSAVLLAALYALNPLTYLAGSAWGQVDSVPSLLLIIAVLLIMKNRWRYALPVYVLAVLMKPQALMVGPLGLLALVMMFVWQKNRSMVKDVLLGIGFSLVVAAAVALPFFNEQNGIAWLIGLYGNTMSYYHYATVNAANLYFLFGMNWVDIGNTAPFLLRLTGSLTVIIPVIITFLRYFQQQPKEKKKIISKDTWPYALMMIPALLVLIPLSLASTGTLLMVSVFMIVAAMFFKGKDNANLPLLASILLIGFSVLGTMMHERYLFLAVALLTLSYTIRRDRRILILLIAVSALCFLNTGVALDRGIRIGGSMGNLDAPSASLVSDSAWLEYALSFLSLPLVSYSLYQGFVLSRQGNTTQELLIRSDNRALKSQSRFDFLKMRDRASFDRKDALLILLVTLMYAVLALVNLGSTKAPQQPWESSPERTEATLDLGEQRNFKLLLYGGIHWQDSDFQVEVSLDGEQFVSHPYQLRQGDLFAWRYLSHPYQRADGITEFDSIPRELEGRYVRISGMTSKLTLMEIIAQDFVTSENLPFVSANQGAEALIDEQDTIKGAPTWFNSMYFDEIYHARTAYEQRNALLGLEPSQIYETSHPPLGKVFMTFSVMLFGMTPFGWRFAGAMAGILMLPGMYLLGKQLTKRRSLGLFAMLLMMFDFMHFTQTRIATIDSFVTMFIIYAYFFMFRYMMLDHWRTKFNKKLVLLFLSGLMMGLGIASKWTGIYAGAGLAVLFFWTLGQNIARGLRIQRVDEKDLGEWVDNVPEVKNYGLRSASEAMQTCLWCLLFFIAIPAGIYYLSFLPVFISTPGGLTVSKVINANTGMFNYHSSPGLGADHPWSSPWHSWPLIRKPMYFYSGGVKNGSASVIWSFGNPLVWWGGLLALMMTVYTAVYQRFASARHHQANLNNDSPGILYDARPVMLLVAFLAQYLPWVLVPRGTYIYHYFPSVPFIILCMVLMTDYLYRRNRKAARLVWTVMTVLAAVLFIAFFPYISGVRVSTAWLDMMKWLPGWLYY